MSQPNNWLTKLEETFFKRYTDEDNEYDLVLTDQDLIPPVLIDWDQRSQKRSFGDHGPRESRRPRYDHGSPYDRDRRSYGQRDEDRRRYPQGGRRSDGYDRYPQGGRRSDGYDNRRQGRIEDDQGRHSDGSDRYR